MHTYTTYNDNLIAYKMMTTTDNNLRILFLTRLVLAWNNSHPDDTAVLETHITLGGNHIKDKFGILSTKDGLIKFIKDTDIKEWYNMMHNSGIYTEIQF